MKTRRVKPRDVVILEGLYALYDERIRAQMSVGVFLLSSAEEQRRRKLVRYTIERHSDSEIIQRKLDDAVEPAYREHVEPIRRWADEVTSDLEEAKLKVVIFIRKRTSRINPRERND